MAIMAKFFFAYNTNLLLSSSCHTWTQKKHRTLWLVQTRIENDV
jgi:hypothetical protein